MIKIYESSAKIFDGNGNWILHPTKAIMEKEDNGNYLIDIEAPLAELGYLQEGMIAVADTPWGAQGFRLTNPETNSKRVKVRGWHLFFDAARYIIADSYVVDKNANEALLHLAAATDAPTPFTVSSDILDVVNSARIVRKNLAEAIQVVVDRWGGHLERDNWNIVLRKQLGQDNGVVISYGKNLVSAKTKECWDAVATKIMPVGRDGLLLPEKWLTSSAVTYDIPYTKVVSFGQTLEEEYETEEAEEAALIDDLRRQGERYLDENQYLKAEYTIKAYLQQVTDVGDTIHVKHPRINIDLLTTVTELKYDCIAKKYTEVTFGSTGQSLKGFSSSISQSFEEVKETTRADRLDMERALETATAEIWGTLGNSYVIYDGDKILVVDALPKEDAKNVLLINAGGIGMSTTGINGTFRTAWTIDGTFDAQAVNVINLNADNINTGTLDAGRLVVADIIKKINEDTGATSISSAKVEIDGKSLYSQYSDLVETVAGVAEATSSVKQTADGIQIDVTQMMTDNSDFLNQFYQRFRFLADGLHIGTDGGEFETLFKDTKISFIQKGIEVAYIQHNRLWIQEARIKSSVVWENEAAQKYAKMILNTDGYLCIQAASALEE